MHHPDVVMLADAAEADLRVLVLHREAEKIMQSTVGRRFGTYTNEPAVLVDNALVLAGQMELIDPAFYTCADVVQVAEIPPAAWAFILPETPTADLDTNNRTLCERFRADSMHSSKGHADVTANLGPAEMADFNLEVANLALALRLIRSHCPAGCCAAPPAVESVISLSKICG